MVARVNCCSDKNIRSCKTLFRDEKVTLITLEGQFKVCGCFFVLILAIVGLMASLWAVFHSFEFVREGDLE